MTKLIPISIVETRIFFIRGYKVMIDSDLAELYQVSTKALNQAVKRNLERFPKMNWSQIVTGWLNLNILQVCRTHLLNRGLPCFQVCYKVRERFKLIFSLCRPLFGCVSFGALYRF